MTLHADPAWDATVILTAETGVLVLLAMVLSVLLAPLAGRRLLPLVVGHAITVIIATFGPLSGGSANPTRQFGPAFLAQDTHPPVDLPARFGDRRGAGSSLRGSGQTPDRTAAPVLAEKKITDRLSRRTGTPAHAGVQISLSGWPGRRSSSVPPRLPAC
ncbi:aquaporin [Streptomyces sp. NPDC059218]|uniref:aquaporin n=1 Tax=Streptomyces sp. NPDC059218 TaxID=3346773 RepID=UPI00369A3856